AAAERKSPAAARAGDLKKRGRLLCERASDTFALIHARKAMFPIATMCQALGVSPSGYYAWSRRPESPHAQRDRHLRVLVRASHEASKRRYGRPRVWKDLHEAGERVSEKRVGRL